MIESRKPATAFSGTRIDRKASASSTSAMPTITATNGGSASLSLAETSMFAAVVPVTSIRAPVSARRASRWSRMSVTSCRVSAWSGPVLGTTGTSAVPLGPSNCGGSSV